MGKLVAGNAFRQDPNAPGVADAAKAFWDMGASTLRGGVASLAGAPGDLEEAIRALNGNPDNKYSTLPTSKFYKEWLSPVNPGAKPNPYEDVGEWLNPTSAPIKEATALSKAMMLAASIRDPQVREAVEMTKKGANKYEIWQATQREQVPQAFSREALPPQNRQWMREIDDTRASLKPGPYIAGGKHLVPGDYMLTDILDHPELFKEAPRFKNVMVKVDPYAGDFYGGYNVKDKVLYLNPIRMSSPGAPHPLDVIIHELQHDEQAKRGWSKGANTRMFEATGKQLRGMDLMYERGPHLPARKAVLEKTLGMRHDPEKMYHFTLGEQQARATEGRRNAPDDLRAHIPPSQYYDAPKYGFDSEEMERVLKEAKHIKPSKMVPPFSKPMSEQLGEVLKTWGREWR
jgi:hypothetical protein